MKVFTNDVPFSSSKNKLPPGSLAIRQTSSRKERQKLHLDEDLEKSEFFFSWKRQILALPPALRSSNLGS